MHGKRSSWLRIDTRGLAAGNTQGVVASRARFVLISNPDVLYAARAIYALLDLMRRPDRAAFAVRLRGINGDLQTPTLWEALLGSA